MVRAWYMNKDDDIIDQRSENHRNPPQFIDVDQLFKLTGFEVIQLNMNTYETDGVLDEIRKSRGYTDEDEITVSKECLPDFEEKLKLFFTEHIHSEQEIRFILEGSGYSDVRDGNDEWIRIEIVPGDMIIIPKGIYHRFTLDTQNYIKAKLYFIGVPKRVQYERPADHMQARQEYLEQFKTGFTRG